MLVALALSIGASTAAQGQTPPAASALQFENAFRDRVVLGAEFELERQLASLAQLRDTGRWQDATALVRRLLADAPGAVVEAEPHHYLGLRAWLQSELATWPSEGLTVYRDAVDPAAMPRYQDALSRRDIPSMQSVADEYFGSSVYDDACWQLAHWAWVDGDLAAAESYWSRLLPRSYIVANAADVRVAQPVDCDYPPEQVLARLAMCRIFLRGEYEARQAVEAYRQLFPTEPGTLAGRSGPLSDSLADAFESRQNWDRSKAAGLPAGVSRESAFDVQGLSWTRELPVSVPTITTATALHHAAPSPATHEVIVHGDTLITLAPHRIQVFNVSTGEPLWPTGDADDDGSVYASTIAEESQHPILSGEGIPRASGVVVDGRLYAAIGWPILVEAETEMRKLPSRIICLDVVHGEGLIDWIVDDRDILPDNWRFSGEPALVDDQLLVPTTTESGSVSLGLASLNASDGTVRWHREVCGVIDTRPARTHVYGHNRLCVSNGQVIWSTMFGCVLKIEPQSGHVLWAVNYPSVEDHGAFSSHESSAIALPFVWGGVVYVTGVSQHRVLAIDETHGVIRWSTPIPTRVTHLVGERDGILVAGGESLWGIDASSGEPLWRSGFDSPDGSGTGTGVIAGETVWWTSRDALLGADLRTGALVARHEIHAAWGLRGGTLITTPDHLLLLESGRISAISIR